MLTCGELVAVWGPRGKSGQRGGCFEDPQAEQPEHGDQREVARVW